MAKVFVAKPEIDILKVVYFLCSSTLQLLKNTQVMCQQYFSVAKTDAKDFLQTSEDWVTYAKLTVLAASLDLSWEHSDTLGQD